MSEKIEKWIETREAYQKALTSAYPAGEIPQKVRKAYERARRAAWGF